MLALGIHRVWELPVAPVINPIAHVDINSQEVLPLTHSLPPLAPCTGFKIALVPENQPNISDLTNMVQFFGKNPQK